MTKVDNILKNDGLNGLKKQQKKLVKNFKDNVSNMFELNTYGNVLYTINKHEEAIEVFKLNTNLFPENPITYMSLANVLGLTNKKEEAILVLEKAIKLFPENKDLIDNLETLKYN